MMKRFQIWMLPILTGGILSSIYFLPQSGEMEPSASSMELPQELNGWVFRQKPPSAEEVQLLAEDTEFSKAVCFKPREGEFDAETGQIIPDRIDLSIVLSGHDLNNSIHRPQRCMPAQGHTINETQNFELKLPNGKKLPVQRLISMQSLPTNEAKTEYIHLNCVTYYFFVGRKRLTEDHTERTLIDIKDRLLFGLDQRWAYVSASMWYGDLPWIEPEVGLEEADQKLREFLISLGKEQIDWSKIN